MMMHRQPRLRALTSVAAVAALFLSAGLYLYLYSHTQSLADRAVVGRDTLRGEQRNQADRKNWRFLSETTAAARAQLPEHFVPASDAVSFIQALEAVGPASGAAVSIASISADKLESAAPGSVSSIAVRMSATGSWAAVMRALELAETLPYRSVIDRVSLTAAVSPPGSKPAAGKPWQMTLDISASTLAARPRSAPITPAP